MNNEIQERIDASKESLWKDRDVLAAQVHAQLAIAAGLEKVAVILNEILIKAQKANAQ